jgi:DNA repair protein RadA/Sms
VEKVAIKTAPAAKVEELSQVAQERLSRLVPPLGELNRVLGGGIVPGSLILIGGDPGIGKSTLLLQVSDLVAQKGGKVVYACGEESITQVKLRAERLGVKGEGLFLLSETELDTILNTLDTLSPQLVVIDSIQTVYLPELEGAPGSLSQVRECTLRLMRWAKERAIPIFISGHVTKEGAIAGPKALEHIVDVVLYLEGETYSSYRILRGVKNRFGSTNEVGVFEMRGTGLIEVDNPSRVFLTPQRGKTSGCAVVPVLEGTRPLLVEIQALTTPTIFGTPRRLANGVEFNRLLLIAAILSQRARLSLGNQDIMVNVVGGYKVSEPAADLGIALAIASSFRGVEPIPHTVVLGEVGLTGELRPAPQLERRLKEATRLGFKRCLTPLFGHPPPLDIELIPVTNLSQALKRVLSTKGEET